MKRWLISGLVLLGLAACTSANFEGIGEGGAGPGSATGAAPGAAPAGETARREAIVVLVDLGYLPVIDGGAADERLAIQAFERHHGMPVSGDMSPALLDRLRTAVVTRQVQRRLAELGYMPGQTDGFPWPATGWAVERFQKRHGFEVDGRPTSGVLEQIRLVKLTIEVQEGLEDLNYDPGPVDGIAGPRTTRALREFGRHRGLRETVAISETTLEAIHEARLTAQIQQRLADAGFSLGPVDGIHGPNTRRAIQEFEQHHGLPVVGEISIELIARLDEADTTARIQRRLASLGFDPGPADGIAGPRTRGAIEAFERARGLRVEGVPSHTVLAELSQDVETPGASPATDGTTRFIEELQSLLAGLGYEPGPVDGFMGARTWQAVEAFRRDNGVPLELEVTSATLRELKAARLQQAAARPPGERNGAGGPAIAADEPQDGLPEIERARPLAQQGDPVAQYTLAARYHTGEGVLRDFERAAEWYKRAAAQGFAEAQFNLGVLYAFGEGVEGDPSQAHMWFNLAAAQGHEEARFGRDFVELEMNAGQIADAQKLAVEWSPD